MLESLKYINHLNESFNFGSSGIYVNSSDLHDYEWSVTNKGNKISALSRRISTRTLPVIILSETEEDGINARNTLMEVTEKDVLAMIPGKIVIGRYYFTCFVTKSTKTEYLSSKKRMQLELTLTSDYPFWIKETSTSFRSDAVFASGGSGFEYPFDYPIDFNYSASNQVITNPGFVSSAFRMIIYGSAVNPSITIGGHVYQVNTTINEGEYLTIDSVNKTIQLKKTDGTVENKFSNRSKSSYVFEQIPPGQSNVAWEGSFNFDLILLEERSEPKWI